MSETEHERDRRILAASVFKMAQDWPSTGVEQFTEPYMQLRIKPKLKPGVVAACRGCNTRKYVDLSNSWNCSYSVQCDRCDIEVGVPGFHYGTTFKVHMKNAMAAVARWNKVML